MRGILLLASLMAASTLLPSDRPIPSHAQSGIRQEPFAFGVEYLVPGLARTYAATGVTWGKTQPAGFDWDVIEPKPPVNGQHAYRWDWSDRLIREWQEAGFRNFHIYLQCRNRWASSKPLPATGHPSYPPKAEYMDDYAAYVRAMVERYDCDGKDDMPGLRYPIRYWEIEAEWGTFWKGTIEEYHHLLRVARQAAREADPRARIILQGYIIWGIFEGEPDAAELQQRLSHALFGKSRRAVLELMPQTLRYPELYDVVEFHSLSDYTEIPTMARHLRSVMRELGIEKPIWVGDVNLSLNPMIYHNMPNYPYTQDQLPRIRRWLAALKNKQDARHDLALRWFRAEQASFTAKKIVCAMGEGLAGINMGNLEDWEIFALAPSFTGTTAFCGLIDRAPIHRLDEDRRPLEPRPAFWTIKLLVNTLGTYRGYERLSLGPGIYAYRFTAPTDASAARSTIVAWYDDGKGHLPDDPPPMKRVSIPTAAHQVLRASIITRIGRRDASWETQSVANAHIPITLTSTPVLLRER